MTPIKGVATQKEIMSPSSAKTNIQPDRLSED